MFPYVSSYFAIAGLDVLMKNLIFFWIIMSLPSLLYTLRCYSCANDFIVWHWRHFFLKRNYGLTTSDEGCVKPDYDSYNLQTCATTCFILYLNGTNRYDGKISILGECFRKLYFKLYNFFRCHRFKNSLSIFLI